MVVQAMNVIVLRWNSIFILTGYRNFKRAGITQRKFELASSIKIQSDRPQRPRSLRGKCDANQM